MGAIQFGKSLYVTAVLALAACSGNADQGGSDGGAALGTGGVSPGDGSGAGGRIGSSLLGTQCSEDADCPAGLSCVSSDSNAFGGGGPPGGLCTLPCTTDDDCGAFDAHSVCVTFGSPAAANFCLQRCEEGSSSKTKCQGRTDMVCSPLVDPDDRPTVAACEPMCGGDFDCPGRKCDFRSGMCVAKTSGTLPIGSACDAQATTDPCNGFCVNPYGETDAAAAKFGTCFGVCSLNIYGVGCGIDQTSQPPFDTECLAPSSAAVGDLALCYQLCNCNDDCLNKALICRPWTDTGSASATGRKGYCRGPVDDIGEAVPDLKCTATGGDSGTPRVDAGLTADAARD